jgi:hypothetical protein
MDHDLSNDGSAIHDPVFHDRLNNAMDHGPFHDGLDDLSFYDATLDDGTNNMLLDNPMLHARLVIVVLDFDPAPSGSVVEAIIIVQGIASTKLRGSRN